MRLCPSSNILYQGDYRLSLAATKTSAKVKIDIAAAKVHISTKTKYENITLLRNIAKTQ